jgi:hypothetical protein
VLIGPIGAAWITATCEKENKNQFALMDAGFLMSDEAEASIRTYCNHRLRNTHVCIQFVMLQYL